MADEKLGGSDSLELYDACPLGFAARRRPFDTGRHRTTLNKSGNWLRSCWGHIIIRVTQFRRVAESRVVDAQPEATT